jgi:hypothetical protein
VSWNLDAARETFRALIGDGTTDHFEFKAQVVPTPDSRHTEFFVGRTRVVDEEFTVCLNGEDYTGFDLAAESGVVTMDSAPSGVLLCSFYYQWFTDAEIAQFLADAVTLIGFEGVTDTTFPIALRSVVFDLAMSIAFTRKAAEYAESLQASSPDGYSVQTDKSAPNWTKLASDALARAEKKWKWYLESPLAAGRPAMAFSRFRLPVYMPRT